MKAAVANKPDVRNTIYTEDGMSSYRKPEKETDPDTLTKRYREQQQAEGHRLMLTGQRASSVGTGLGFGNII